jgi:hypothetical protein
MSTVLFSKTFINKIHSIIRKFWWAGVQAENPTNPIAFRSWDDISKPKNQGGLGIRDMELINKSLLIHTAWNIVMDKNPFLSNIMKAKYYPNSSFWTSPTSRPKSVFWSSVLQIKHHLSENSIIQIHAGNSSIWSSPWMSSWSNIHDHILLLLYLQKSLIYGCRVQQTGIMNYSPLPSPTMWYNKSSIPL